MYDKVTVRTRMKCDRLTDRQCDYFMPLFGGIKIRYFSFKSSTSDWEKITKFCLGMGPLYMDPWDRGKIACIQKVPNTNLHLYMFTVYIIHKPLELLHQILH
jgi:hypothetical protein